MRPAADDDFPAIVALINALNPEYPPVTVERMRSDRASLPPGIAHGSLVARERGQNWLERPGFSPATFWVALHGDRVVGLAQLRDRGDGFAENAYTAVDRQYRGRGIARALKLQGVEWARRNGVRRLITWNDAGNAPMLAVNMAMGYRPLPGTIELVRNC